MPDRVPCTQCQSMILPQTARIHGGWCAACARRSREKAARKPAKELFLYLLDLICLPFALVFHGMRVLVRRWRFPHDRKALLQTIAQVYPEPHVARSYLAGVIKGYFDHTPEFVGWAEDYAFMEGRNDGGRLWRREIKAADIPTSRGALVGEIRAVEKKEKQT